ncbi:EI24 domain-containing protein [Comamonas sp. CAH-2]|uniref:EI24 domain-containing protein n=1 Tax=Comamonas sp. CAH-2 TaxID=2605745 RepID=UPI0012AE568D|nr:EI24 domain-containing protein [Comamonas sp. CAH-2]MRT21461.1 EI24 domain-containing protein [Comamonas sp. CAH-2]
MHMILDALWRAVTDCLRGRVIAWSLFPLLLVAGMAALVGVFWWDAAAASVQAWLEWLWGWMGQGTASASAVAAAVLLVLVISPVMVMVALAIVAVVMTPQMVALVAERRFPQLQRKQGAGWVGSALWALGSTAMALLALVLSMPLWLVPPLVLVLPPLIWGWLTYRVMAFDALAEHASPAERQTVLATHRYRLLLMGVVCGYLGAAPSLVWASGVVFAAAFWVLIPVAVWIYALVLAFSSLWFAHYGLVALDSLREHAAPDAGQAAPPAGTRP